MIWKLRLCGKFFQNNLAFDKKNSSGLQIFVRLNVPILCGCDLVRKNSNQAIQAK
jgi:hypothetical protein